MPQLQHRFGSLPEAMVVEISGLSSEAWDALTEVLLDFEVLDETAA